MSDKLESALAWARAEWKVFPVHPAEAGEKRKRPMIPNWRQNATTDERRIEGWWANWPHADPAWAVEEGYLVVDLDDGVTPEEAELYVGVLPATRTHRTPRGGTHLFYTTDEHEAATKARLAPGVDCRGPGGYVVLPTEGNDYEIERT